MPEANNEEGGNKHKTVIAMTVASKPEDVNSRNCLFILVIDVNKTRKKRQFSK